MNAAMNYGRLVRNSDLRQRGTSTAATPDFDTMLSLLRATLVGLDAIHRPQPSQTVRGRS